MSAWRGPWPTCPGAPRRWPRAASPGTRSTRFARPEEDEALAAQATGKSAAALEWAARRARRISRGEAQDEHERRGLRWWLPHDGGFRLSARLPAADGAVVAAALERLSDQLPAERAAHDGVFEPATARYADALVALASGRLAEDSDADRACVVVHVDAGALAGGDGGAQLEEGSAVGLDVARRLACDGRLELVAESERGPIGVGRARRTIPAWLMRLLRRRDGVCQFPGCGRRRWLQGHHVKHWVDDGRTDLDNLLLTCRPHHKLVHEFGWKVERGPDGHATFRKPNGQLYEVGPPALRPEVRRHLAAVPLLC